MGNGRVRSPADDRLERKRIGPPGVHRRFQPTSDGALSLPRSDRRQHVSERLVGDAARLRDEGHLVDVLHDAAFLNEARGLAQVRHRLEQGAQARDAEMLGFDGERASALRGRMCHRRQGLAVDEQRQSRTFRPGLRHVAAVGTQQHRIGRKQEDAVAAGEAREVAHVDERGHEQGSCLRYRGDDVGPRTGAPPFEPVGHGARREAMARSARR